MTEKHEKLLADFEVRMRQLMFLCDSLRSKNADLQKEIESKDVLIESLGLEVNQLKAKYDNLKFAQTLVSGDPENVNNAKTRLSKLVREVDKCIALLKN